MNTFFLDINTFFKAFAALFGKRKHATFNFSACNRRRNIKFGLIKNATAFFRAKCRISKIYV